MHEHILGKIVKTSMIYQLGYKIWIFVAFICIDSIVYAQGLTTKWGGEYTVEGVSAVNMNTLNERGGNDFIWYVRSTLDCSLDVMWGKDETAIIHFYDAVRFRYFWGNGADTYLFDGPVMIGGVSQNILGTSVNKHLLWMREGWLKFGLSDVVTDRNVKIGIRPNPDSYIQLGLIPFEVGRGISLGSAYDSSGFLGFRSDFSIDQYAPAGLINLSVVPDKYSIRAYGAILKNKQITVDDNFEIANTKDLQSFSTFGIGKQAYVFVFDHTLHNPGGYDIDIEPYLVYLWAPDQIIEFMHDTDISLLTLGVAVEGIYNRWNWGFECAGNLGELLLKAWDRNLLSCNKNDDGNVVVRYTKVYDQDPKLITAALAQATAFNDGFVGKSAKDCRMNGKQIGPNLYNAYDRFRARQCKKFDGYFAVADAMYDVIPNRLQWAVGAGYASGDFDARTDTNKMSDHHCMHQKFSGFIPLQSEYAGKRIRHVVVFNQGLPRCDNRDSDQVKETNLINDIQSVTIRDFTNIAFVGTRAIWRPRILKDHELELSGNLVGYWTPEPTRIESVVDKHRFARDFLGVELSSEFSWTIMKNLKCAGYAGVFFPGPFYRDHCGEVLRDLKTLSGSDVGFIADIVMTYDF